MTALAQFPDEARLRVVRWVRRLVAKAEASEYLRVGAGRRFRAVQRRRTVTAARAGFAIIAGAAFFDALALFDLHAGNDLTLILLNGSMVILAVVSFFAVSRRLRRRPEPLTGLVTLALTAVTATTGFLLPSLAVQTIGYLVLLPGLMALMLPWSTGSHFRWLAGYGAIALTFVALGTGRALTNGDRGDLAVVIFIAIGTSLAGHALLQRAQIQNFAQLEKIRSLRRRAEADMAELGRVHTELEVTARTDALTGAANRVRLLEDLRAARARMDRLHESHALVVIDLDHFKLVNDHLGHLTGDHILRSVVDLIKGSIRDEDTVYRFGGEEFLVLLRVKSADDLAQAVERIRLAVVDGHIVHPENSPSNFVTISAGAVLVTPDDLAKTDDEWFARADEALYRAKANGRNRGELAA
jgi:diguanylate cyclase (GGDEF)-like protein